MNKSRISKSTGTMMIAVAAAIDFLQFILTLIPIFGWIVSPLVSFCTWGLYFFWLKSHDVHLYDGERVLGTMGAMLGETFPFINAFPWWTARIFVTVQYEWQQESKV